MAVQATIWGTGTARAGPLQSRYWLPATRPQVLLRRHRQPLSGAAEGLCAALPSLAACKIISSILNWSCIISLGPNRESRALTVCLKIPQTYLMLPVFPVGQITEGQYREGSHFSGAHTLNVSLVSIPPDLSEGLLSLGWIASVGTRVHESGVISFKSSACSKTFCILTDEHLLVPRRAVNCKTQNLEKCSLLFSFCCVFPYLK